MFSPSKIQPAGNVVSSLEAFHAFASLSSLHGALRGRPPPTLSDGGWRRKTWRGRLKPVARRPGGRSQRFRLLPQRVEHGWRNPHPRVLAVELAQFGEVRVGIGCNRGKPVEIGERALTLTRRGDC